MRWCERGRQITTQKLDIWRFRKRFLRGRNLITPECKAEKSQKEKRGRIRLLLFQGGSGYSMKTSPRSGRGRRTIFSRTKTMRIERDRREKTNESAS